jgi:cell division protein FtsL
MQASATDAMGFAIGPAIKNRPVAAEVDRVRQRDILRWLLVGAVLVAAALFDGWQRYGILDFGFKLSDVQRERAAEEMKGRLLRLEIETLRAPGRIEAMAGQLQLVAPGPSDAVVIERVVPPEPPPSSVIASR